jgi:hypothetical protein
VGWHWTLNPVERGSSPPGITNKLLMKKAEYFLEKTPLWKVFIVFLFVATSLFFFLFELLLNKDLHIGNPNINVTPEKNLILSMVFGSFVSGTITYMLSVVRMSEQFFRECNLVEEKIKEAKTRDDIQIIYNDLFAPLVKKAWHLNQKIRLKYMHSSMIQVLQDIGPATKSIENISK